MPEPRIDLSLSLTQLPHGHPNSWQARLVVSRTSINIEAYGETPSHALQSLADGLGTDEWSTLRWAAEHQEATDA